MLSSKYYNDDSLISSDDSEDYHEIFYSSSSHDRSSIGSIPWAEDAIKQNQQEWERVERMFYGEENLPENDEDLRNEIIEWNNAFPHLRIVGKKVNINSVNEIKSSTKLQSPNKLNDTSGDEDEEEETIKEEIIAVHPLPGHGVNRAFIHTFHTNFINDYSNIENATTSAKSFQHRKSNSDVLLSSILEKDLRISSVPMIRRRTDRAVKAFAILPPAGASRIFSSQTKISIPNEKKSIARFSETSRNNFYANSHNIPSAKSSIIPIRRHQKNSSISSTAASMKSVSSASSFLRMPPILNIILPSSSSHHNEFNSILRKRNKRADENYSISEIGTSSGRSDSVRKEKRRIILPAINQFHNGIKNQSENVATRSVSAAVI